MEKIQAIVIKSSDRKEKDKNILLFSIENGKFWATLKGVKGANAKMKLAQNPFCFAEFVVEDGKTGKIVTGFEVIESFHELCENVDKFFEAAALLELVSAFDFESKGERAMMFVLLVKALKTICFETVRELYVLNKFMLETFKLNGTPLNAQKCSNCGTGAFEKLFINTSTGELECVSCKSFCSEEILPNVLSAMKILSKTDFEKLGTLKLSAESEILLLKLLVKNFENRFGRKLNFVGILR